MFSVINPTNDSIPFQADGRNRTLSPGTRTEFEELNNPVELIRKGLRVHKDGRRMTEDGQTTTRMADQSEPTMEEQVEGEGNEITEEDVEEAAWQDLLSLASEYDIGTVGKDRDEIEEELKEVI